MERKIIKKISFLLIISMIVAYLPMKQAEAISNVNIVSNTEITKAAAKAYMKSKGATDEFVGLADLYWQYSNKNGNVNPAVAYVQAAKETGYGKFGGIIDASYHNPCGLKTTKGGADNDPNAHQRFANWSQGVQAHLDHLALYAGAEGYPRSNTYDPRHFASIKGKAPTVVQLGGAWAPSNEYGNDIMRMYISLSEYNKQFLPAKTIIEVPKNGDVLGNGNYNVDISGWAINASGIKEVKIYVDGNYQGNAEIGLYREDIGNTYSKYPDSLRSGYKYKLNLKQFKTGVRNIKVEQVGKNGTIHSSNISINLENLKPKTVIETPKNNQVVAAGNKDVIISGWAINEDGVKEIKVYVDGQYKGKAETGLYRADIGKAYPNYKGSLKSGYRYKLDGKEYTSGKKTIKIEQIGNDGTKNSRSITIDIDGLKPKTVIEGPQNGVYIGPNNFDVTVSGWAINESGVKEVKVYINDKYVKNAEYGFYRSDIEKGFSEYKGSKNSGYRVRINLKNYPEGVNHIRVEQIGNDGSKDSSFIGTNLKKPEAKLIVEAPRVNSTIGPNNYNAEFVGWGINYSGVKEIRVYLEGKYKGNAEIGFYRKDIGDAYSNYTDSYNSGFKYNLNLQNEAPGRKEVELVMYGKDGSKHYESVSFKYQKKVPVSNIESPSIYQNIEDTSAITVSGWAINDSGIKEVKVYLNGRYKGNATTGYRRSDIAVAYPNYRGCIDSGYKLTIDTVGIKKGINTITVNAYGNDGSVDSKNIMVGRKKTVVIDPGHNIIGGIDTGSVSYHNGVRYDEGELNMKLSLKLKNQLEKQGYNVVLTRNLGELVEATTVRESLQKRVRIAELADADLFVSVHHNNYTSSSAHGSEVLYSNPKSSDIKPEPYAGRKSKELAVILANKLASSGSFYNRGAKNSGLYVTKNTTMPAVLLEAGFISNKSDAIKASSSKNQEKVAQSLSISIRDWLD